MPTLQLNVTIPPKTYQDSSNSNFEPSLQPADRDDFKFIDIIENYFQNEEGQPFPHKNIDSSTASSRAVDLPSMAESVPLSGIVQSTDTDDSKFIDILEQLCRDFTEP